MNRYFSIFALLVCLPLGPLYVAAQAPNAGAASSGSMALSPARFELEMKPGTETTVVVNLDYRAPEGAKKEAARIVATLNDWSLTKDGRVEFFRANYQPNSASPWLIYSPGEAAVMPGSMHQIRVTIAVPANAAPGDHLAALIIEQRPENLKTEPNLRQMIIRYRMATVFYIKVPGLTKRGSFENLYAESTPDGIVVTPTLKNEGNSLVRPVSSVKVVNAEGSIVAEMADFESIPVLGGAELSRPVLLNQALAPGNYTVKYKVDFQDGSRATEGVTDLVVKPGPRIASTAVPAQKP
jgi:hypothetical protein